MSLTDLAQEVKQEKRGGVYEYTDHPIAELFPLMSGADLAELAKDINENGQREDIVVYQGKILDGRNRYRACLLADVEPRVTSYIGTDPIRDVLSWNLHRRHLDVSQRAAIATAALPLLEKQARERKAEAARKLNAARKGSPVCANLHTPEGRGDYQRGRKAGHRKFARNRRKGTGPPRIRRRGDNVKRLPALSPDREEGATGRAGTRRKGEGRGGVTERRRAGSQEGGTGAEAGDAQGA